MSYNWHPISEKEITQFNGNGLADMNARKVIENMGEDLTDTILRVETNTNFLDNHIRRDIDGVLEYTDDEIILPEEENFYQWKLYAITLEYSITQTDGPTQSYTNTVLGVLDDNGVLFLHQPAPFIKYIDLRVNYEDEGDNHLSYVDYGEIPDENFSITGTPKITQVIGII